jgi:hypothetical protein
MFPSPEVGTKQEKARLRLLPLPCLGPDLRSITKNAGGAVDPPHRICSMPVPGQSNRLLDSEVCHTVGHTQAPLNSWAVQSKLRGLPSGAINRFFTHDSTFYLTFCTFICTSEQRITNTSVRTPLQVSPL